MVGEECWNSDLDGRLQVVATSIHLEVVVASIQSEVAVAATSKSARLRETRPMASLVLDPYENRVTRKFDSCTSKNLNSELKKEENYTYDPLKRGVEVLLGALGCRPYGERHADYMNYTNH
jgi:hypothetical protein